MQLDQEYKKQADMLYKVFLYIILSVVQIRKVPIDKFKAINQRILKRNSTIGNYLLNILNILLIIY